MRGPSRISVLLFRVASRAHPRAFRERYGAEMRAYFEEGLRAQGNWRARQAHVLRSVAGAVAAGVRQRMKRGDGAAGNGGDGWRLDLKHAFRSLQRRPALASLVMLTLAVGIGANAAVFGALYSVVLSPLPYAAPERLVRLYQDYIGEEGSSGYLTLPALVHYRDHAQTLSGVAGVYTYNPEGADLTGSGRPERIRVLRVSADYFPVLGVSPAMGRAFRRDEERADVPVLIASAALSERIGETAVLDGVTHDVIGVMPRAFEDPLMGEVDAWLPLDLPTGGYESWQWDNHYLSAIARLAPGHTVAEARAEIAHLSLLQAEISDVAAEQRGRLLPLHADVVGDSDTLLAILMSAVGLLLLITFVNVAVLLVARGLERTHEIAVRSALGSPRVRIARQFLFEGLLLALGGGVAGALLGVPLHGALAAAAPSAVLNRAGGAPLWPLVAFGMGGALLAGIIFGLAPAIGMGAVDPTGALRQAGRGTDRRFAIRMREGLVVTQVALALVLAIGAGVLSASLERLRRVPLHIETNGVLTYEVNLPESRYGSAEQQILFRSELQRRLSGVSGVRSAAAISHLPVTGRTFTWGVRRALGETDAEDRFVAADQRVVSGDAFAVLGIPLLHGRLFGPQDDGDAPLRVVVNAALARDVFGDAAAAVGDGVRIAGARREIIGVVADVPVTARGEAAPMVYHSDRQYSAFWTRNLVQMVAIRPGAPDPLPAIAREVRALDPELVVHRPRPLVDVVGGGRARERFAAQLVTAFATLAVALSALGLYGVLSHAVRRRRREIGIRLALGADDRSVLSMLVRHGVSLAAVGVALGLVGALAATRGLRSLVFGVDVHDARVFAAAAAVLIVVALIASALPALRALRVSPVETFRAE